MASSSSGNQLGWFLAVGIGAFALGRSSVSAPPPVQPATAASEPALPSEPIAREVGQTPAIERVPAEAETSRVAESPIQIAKPVYAIAGDEAEPSVYFRNCSAARAAGAAPVRYGDPGYASHLDRDSDGVGCE